MPPPLPAHALKPASDPPPKPTIDSGLESEIDDALGGLELEGPTGTTLPGPSALSSVPSTTAETLARPGISFGGSMEESTQSAAFVPGAMRNSAPATERPSSPGEPPSTIATEGPPPTVTGEGSHEVLDAHDLEDMDDANGAVDQALESTHAGAKEDDIVIADDLAEDIGDEPTDIKALLDDEEEHTDAGVPPYRPGH